MSLLPGVVVVVTSGVGVTGVVEIWPKNGSFCKIVLASLQSYKNLNLTQIAGVDTIY